MKAEGGLVPMTMRWRLRFAIRFAGWCGVVNEVGVW